MRGEDPHLQLYLISHSSHKAGGTDPTRLEKALCPSDKHRYKFSLRTLDLDVWTQDAYFGMVFINSQLTNQITGYIGKQSPWSLIYLAS